MYALPRRSAPFGALEPTQSPSPRSFSFSKLFDGIPRGCLVEISGKDATAQVASFLAEHRQLPVAWVEEDMKKLPEEALRAQNPNLKKILFLDGGKDSSWAANAMLKSENFPIVVYRAPYGDIKELRRFRFFARKANATMILLREEPCFSWPIGLQLRATQDGLEVLRRRRDL
jgi:hypothetical protein